MRADVAAKVSHAGGETMRTKSDKPRLALSLVDAMALIAATALGLASASLLPALMDPGVFVIYKHEGQYPLLVATMTLLALTLTPLMLALVGRRDPPDRERPGQIACVSV